MKSGFLSSALLVGGWLAIAAFPASVSAQTLFFDYVGFDYESPNPIPGQFGEIGSGYVGLGFVPSLFTPLVADTANYQYTYQFSGLTALNVTTFGPFAIIDYSPGTLVIYEDSKSSGTPGIYGINPPNGQAPPSFVDGTVFVVGLLSNFRFILDTVSNTGSFEANYDVTGGSQLVNVPVLQRMGWTFAGATGRDIGIPTGYIHQIDGQTFLSEPAPAARASWGAIKARYRGEGR